MSSAPQLFITDLLPLGCDLTDDNVARTIAAKVFIDERYDDLILPQNG